MARKLLEHLCGEDERTWEEATMAVLEALEIRRFLWDAVLKTFESPALKAAL